MAEQSRVRVVDCIVRGESEEAELLSRHELRVGNDILLYLGGERRPIPPRGLSLQ